jgi:hypothetical protein
VLGPVPTVIVPPGSMPSVDSEVLVVTRAVPIAVAGEPEELEVELEVVEDPLDPLDDDEVELPDGFNACSTSDVISLLTRFNAVLLAMLARPLAKFVSAWPITLISASAAEDA